MKVKDYYKEIDKALKPYENYNSYPEKTIIWICDRIDWAWKWRKITEDQKNEVCDRICILFERDLTIMKAKKG